MDIYTKKTFLTFCLLSLSASVYGQGMRDLDLLDAQDLEVLQNSNESFKRNTNLDLSDLEEIDDLQSLKSDIGELIIDEPKERPKQTGVLELRETPSPTLPRPVRDFGRPAVNDPNFVENSTMQTGIPTDTPLIFDVGDEEKKLLDLSRFVESKIPENEWNEIASASNLEKYVVQSGDWLWKISQRLFGSGFYYSKIWALNPQIVNPHEIEPGMTLVFDSGSSVAMPNVRVSDFREQQISDTKPTESLDFREFGQGIEPPWLRERQALIDQGVYFQFASDETYEDLMAIGRMSLRTDYEQYDPPPSEIIIAEPSDAYDSAGFDRDSRISFNVREGFFLNTFVTTNIVQDLGEIVATPNERVFIQQEDQVFLRFDKSVRVKPGDMFSVYGPGGKVSHPVSDRAGYRYTILAQVKIVRQVNDLWEASVSELTGIIQRRDRLTVYTPKINRIVQTFNRRLIEAAILDSHRETTGSLSYGEVVYIDRGRADGVELGNVFELFSFIDRGTGRRISVDPSYKIGELTVITLTDNFATALVSQSRMDIPLGTIALTKTAEQAAIASQLRGEKSLSEVKLLESNALEELDIELNLNDLSRDLLMQADKIQLTDDELEELERQEREKSIIQDHEKDLRELERLEREMLEAERSLNEARVDEDKFLEQHDLNKIESETKEPDPNAFRSLEEIEREVGRRYLDEDLNSKDNPFGLTEFDLEEIDELLNTDKQ